MDIINIYQRYRRLWVREASQQYFMREEDCEDIFSDLFLENTLNGVKDIAVYAAKKRFFQRCINHIKQEVYKKSMDELYYELQDEGEDIDEEALVITRDLVFEDGIPDSSDAGRQQKSRKLKEAKELYPLIQEVLNILREDD